MANLDLARLKALVEWTKRVDARDMGSLLTDEYTDAWAEHATVADRWKREMSPDVILSLIARLEKIEQWATDVNQPSGGYAVAQAEVLRLLREEEK